MTGIFILSGKMEFRKIGYGITFLNCVFQMKYYCGNTDENPIEERILALKNELFHIEIFEIPLNLELPEVSLNLV